MARAIVPVHTSYDSDVSFALASNEINDSFDHLAEIGAEATAEAIRSAVRHSQTVGGVMGIAG
jgi:L-aminopeptidase/D-esterase-like protein